jgi:hypothetical protein
MGGDIYSRGKLHVRGIKYKLVGSQMIATSKTSYVLAFYFADHGTEGRRTLTASRIDKLRENSLVL